MYLCWPRSTNLTISILSELKKRTPSPSAVIDLIVFKFVFWKFCEQRWKLLKRLGWIIRYWAR